MGKKLKITWNCICKVNNSCYYLRSLPKILTLIYASIQCVCVCVCEKERRRERKERGGRKTQSHVDTWLCIWLFWINNMIFFLKHFLMTTSLNAWLYHNLFSKPLWNGLTFLCVCNIINNAAVNDLCTYLLLLPYKSTQGWFKGSTILPVKILRLNN